ncbi:BTB/POZ domain-containing protein [Ditylenchus destructor]|uniref:BTB/POZ domain-containing protein n=1 Tax=Ditylenchus destructor TaxID=166010 RepID=A0AAD4MHM3_9BILA|nr:BTB/POZ domain-containing protein [Ditylenchus destructor]
MTRNGLRLTIVSYESSKLPHGMGLSYKSEGSIELRIDRFAEFVRSEEERYSAPTYIRGLSWEIKAYCEEMDKSNNSDGQSPSKGLSVYLWCQRDSTNRTWECHANYSLRVMAQKEGVKDISQEDLEETFYGMDYWGIDTETCDFLLDPKNGYIKDDTVILQAHVKPITVKTLSGTLAIESYKQLFSSSTQYSWDFVIVIQDEEVHVQKGLLAIHSEYFKDQFAKYEENNRAVLQDVDYEEFIELLSVIYPTFYPITAIEALLLYRPINFPDCKALVDRVNEMDKSLGGTGSGSKGGTGQDRKVDPDQPPRVELARYHKVDPAQDREVDLAQDGIRGVETGQDRKSEPL